MVEFSNLGYIPLHAKKKNLFIKLKVKIYKQKVKVAQSSLRKKFIFHQRVKKKKILELVNFYHKKKFYFIWDTTYHFSLRWFSYSVIP